MAILVAVAIPSLIINSLASETVVLLAEALENNICWPKLQIYIAETACMCLEGITLVSVTIQEWKKRKKPQDKDSQKTVGEFYNYRGLSNCKGRRRRNQGSYLATYNLVWPQHPKDQSIL